MNNTRSKKPYSFFKCLFLSFCLLSPLLCCGQGQIDRSKDELKKGNSYSQPENSDNYTYSTDRPAAHGIQHTVVNGIILGVAYAFVGNYKRENHLNNKLTRYPYQYRLSGNYVPPDSVQRSKYFRVDVENHFLYHSDDLLGNHFKVKLRPFQYFYFQGNVFIFNETDAFNSRRSGLHLFNLDFCYDRIRFGCFNFGWTLGLHYIANDVQQAGFAYGLCTELFLLQSFSVYGCGKLSSINGLPVHQAEAKVRYHRKKLFLSGGYEYAKIATPSYHFLSIGGGIYL